MAHHITARAFMYVLDCPEESVLADFYAGLLGWSTQDDPDYPGWVTLVPGDAADPADTDLRIGFQRVANYLAPEWPEGRIPQQAHLDIYVDSMEESSARAVAAGARRHPHQPSEDGSFVVFVDPAGHPFCLCVEGPV